MYCHTVTVYSMFRHVVGRSSLLPLLHLTEINLNALHIIQLTMSKNYSRMQGAVMNVFEGALLCVVSELKPIGTS